MVTSVLSMLGDDFGWMAGQTLTRMNSPPPNLTTTRMNIFQHTCEDLDRYGLYSAEASVQSKMLRTAVLAYQRENIARTGISVQLTAPI